MLFAHKCKYFFKKVYKKNKKVKIPMFLNLIALYLLFQPSSFCYLFVVFCRNFFLFFLVWLDGSVYTLQMCFMGLGFIIYHFISHVYIFINE